MHISHVQLLELEENIKSARFINFNPKLDFFFPMAQQPLVGRGLIIIKASRSHSGTPQSVGLLWTSDQPDTETST